LKRITSVLALWLGCLLSVLSAQPKAVDCTAYCSALPAVVHRSLFTSSKFARTDSRYHFYISGLYAASFTSEQIYQNFKDSDLLDADNPHQPAASGSSYLDAHYLSFALGAELQLRNHLALGLEYARLPQLSVQYGQDIAEMTSGHGITLWVIYPIYPLSAGADSEIQLSPFLQQRLELLFGAGLGYHHFTIEGALNRNGIADLEKAEGYFIERRSLPGLHLKGGFDLYLWNSISLQLCVQGQLVPAVKVPEQSYLTLKGKTLTLSEHRLNFSHYAITAGLHFHFRPSE